jgi:plasmid stabilization system protein ParE
VDNALAWEERVRAALDALGDAHGHAIDQDASRRVGQQLRKKVFERTYLIHYRINPKPPAVEVVGFRHGARLPSRGEP